MSANWSFETRQIHAGQRPDPTTGSPVLPIFQTTSYVFPSVEEAAERFALSSMGPIYGRLDNPTQEVVENRIASLDGGVGALLTSSGASAITIAILNALQAGDHIVSSASLYGGTFALLRHTLPPLGIKTTFVQNPADLEEWRAAIVPETRMLFGEVIPNPQCDILDMEPIAALAHEHEVPFFVDSTVATPWLCRPIDWGADVVLHSATKYLGGHGTALAGVIVDAGQFDYAATPGRFPQFSEPDAAYNGIVFGKEFGAGGALGANLSFIVKARARLLRDMGPAIAPINAWLIEQGIETLSLRMDRHVSNALAVAQWLEARPDVLSVSYPGLPSSPYHALAQKYTPRGPGAVFTFELAGDVAAGRAFITALRLHSHVANIGDVRSLVIHPASTTHSQLSPRDQEAAGIRPGLIRLSVGLEAVEDIIADLELGFAAASETRAR